MGIGHTLQNLISAKGTNVNAIAVATGVNPQTLYSIIKRDNTKVNIDDLYKVAHFLGVDLNYFYSEYDKEQKNPPAEAEGTYLTKKAMEVARAYQDADPHTKDIVCLTLRLEPDKSDSASGSAAV